MLPPQAEYEGVIGGRSKARDLLSIEAEARHGRYASLDAFRNDCILCFQNAGLWAKAAGEMHRRGLLDEGSAQIAAGV